MWTTTVHQDAVQSILVLDCPVGCLTQKCPVLVIQIQFIIESIMGIDLGNYDVTGTGMGDLYLDHEVTHGVVIESLQMQL